MNAAYPMEWMAAIGRLVGGDGGELARLLLTDEPIPDLARKSLAELVRPSNPPVLRVRLVAKRIKGLTPARWVRGKLIPGKETKRDAEEHAVIWWLHFREDKGMKRHKAVDALREFMTLNRKALGETRLYITLPSEWDEAARVMDKLVKKTNRGLKSTPKSRP